MTDECQRIDDGSTHSALASIASVAWTADGGQPPSLRVHAHARSSYVNVGPIYILLLPILDVLLCLHRRFHIWSHHHVRQPLQPLSRQSRGEPWPGSAGFQCRLGNAATVRPSSLAMGAGCARRYKGTLSCSDVWTTDGECSEKGDHRKSP